MKEKTCKKCGEVKPLDEFPIAKGCKDGHRGECKKCHTKMACLIQSTHSDERKKYMKEYRQKNLSKWKRTPEAQESVNERRRKKYAEDEEHRNKLKEKVKKYNRSNPHIRKSQRLKKFGITLEEYNRLFDLQEGKCAICGYSDLSRKSFFPMVDHCHNNGHVRGLLCSDCNFGLGNFKDNIELLLRAVEYLRKDELWSNG